MQNIDRRFRNGGEPMKFPYGISDFNKIIRGNYFYCDRTDRIPEIEDAGDYLLFIRPRRFGKSLWMSILCHYYDINEKDRFEELFGGLAIGRNPTPLHNRYLILKWDFSCVDPTGTVEQIRQSLYGHVNASIYNFYSKYRKIFPGFSDLLQEDALSSLKIMLAETRAAGYLLYLLIDEYDNFANEVMSGIRSEQDDYNALVHEKGPLKTLFKSVKSSAGEGSLDKIFITGVSPVVMSDITSGFNIAENIYLYADFNDLCGFTENEIRKTLAQVGEECPSCDIEEGMEMMRAYYNGYTFSPGLEQKVYNPTLALYFFKRFQKTGTYPREMLDANLAMDEAKLAFIAGLPRGNQLLLDITREGEPVTVSGISNRFGVSEMLNDAAKTQDFLISFLYYFGVLSITNLTAAGKLELQVPNLVTRGLYVNRIAQFLLPDPGIRDDGRAAAEKVFTQGDIVPLCEFVESRYFQVFHNPDYKWANELTVKTAFLTLLYDDIRYIMDSEREIGRGYVDLTMIIRPDMRKFELLDVLIEFKYVKLSEAGMTGENARKLTPAELQEIPAMKKEMAAAREQAKRYGRDLMKKHGNLRLKSFAVVSLGFERLWAEAV